MVTNKRIWSFIIVVIIIGVVLATFTPKPQTKIISGKGQFNIQTWEMDNGARVYYVNAPQLPMVDVRIVFDAGSARDGDKAGISSLTNNMIAKGAGDWDTDALAERFDSIGARFSVDSMRDMASLSLRTLNDSPLLEQAIITMATVVNQPRFDENELERIRKQTLIGLQGEEQSPSAIGKKIFYQKLYGEHPYSIPVLGTKESVNVISRDDIVGFYKQYYVGRNALVAIVGDVDLEQARQLAEQLIGGRPAGKQATPLADAPVLTDAQTVKHTHPSSQTHIMVGQPGMHRGDPDYFALYVGNHILGGGGFGSRIMEEIREKRGLAYSSYSYFLPMRKNGPFLMSLQTSNDQRDEALALLNQTLQEFIEQGPTAEELDHSIKNITGGFPLRIDSNKDIIEYIAMIGFYELPLTYLDEFNARVGAITIEKIKDAFKRRIHPDKLVTVLVGNGDETEPGSEPASK
ncbi:MAG: insulinase family protein [Gammaproteobacteria bacterium]|nr:insulinase family protein [Gammaproteobacteria bacterium]